MHDADNNCRTWSLTAISWAQFDWTGDWICTQTFTRASSYPERGRQTGRGVQLSSVEFSSIQPIRTDVEKCTNDEDPLSADRDQLNLHRWVRSRSRGRGRRGIRNCKPTHREGGKKFDSSLPDHKNGTHGLEFPATATCLYYDGKYRMTDWYGSLSLPWSDGTERRRESHASVVLNWFCSLYSPTEWNHSQSGWWASVRLSVGAEKER